MSKKPKFVPRDAVEVTDPALKAEAARLFDGPVKAAPWLGQILTGEYDIVAYEGGGKMLIQFSRRLRSGHGKFLFLVGLPLAGRPSGRRSGSSGGPAKSATGRRRRNQK